MANPKDLKPETPSPEDSILAEASKIDPNIQETKVDSNFPEVDSTTESEIIREADLDSKYGDSSVQTFAESTASSLTFGLSDQFLVKTGYQTAEALRERRDRNQAASIAGDIVGTTAPLLLSGGTSLLGKATSTVGAGVIGASKAGIAAEKATEAILKRIIKDTGSKKIAEEIVKQSIIKGTGAAVEGALYGAKELISENALGRADFTAENLMATVSASAFLAGSIGGALGGATALIPTVTKTGKTVLKKTILPDSDDLNKITTELHGYTPEQARKLQQKNKKVYDNLAKYTRENLGVEVMDDAKKLHAKNSEQISKIGSQIGDTLEEVDRLASTSTHLPKRSQVAKKMVDALEEMKKELQISPTSSSKRSLRKLEAEIKLKDEWLLSDDIMSAKELNKLKGSLQNSAKYDKIPGSLTLDDVMVRKQADAVKDEVFALADRVSTSDNALGAKLKDLNLQYATGKEIADRVSKKAAKSSSQSVLGLKDMVFGTLVGSSTSAGLAGVLVAGRIAKESDMRRRMQVILAGKKANIAIESKISKSLKSFFKDSSRVLVPTSTTVLNDSPLAKSENKRKPKNKQEAFTNIRKNITELASNPAALQERVLKSTIRLQNHAPNTALQTQIKLANAAQFLASKLPKDTSNTSLVNLTKREFTPSSQELAKFERYVEAIDNPLSVLDDLQSGNISREKIEVLENVYPEIYAKVQSAAMDMIVESTEPIPYQKRLNLGAMLKIPADASLQPKNINALQSIHDEAAAQAEQQQPTSGPKPINIKLTNDRQSDVERVSNR